jgi:hypothetical protein
MVADTTFEVAERSPEFDALTWPEGCTGDLRENEHPATRSRSESVENVRMPAGSGNLKG